MAFTPNVTVSFDSRGFGDITTGVQAKSFRTLDPIPFGTHSSFTVEKLDGDNVNDDAKRRRNKKLEYLFAYKVKTNLLPESVR